MRSHVSGAKKELKYCKRLVLQIKSGKKEGDNSKNKNKNKLKPRFFKQKAFSKNQLKRQPSRICFLIICDFKKAFFYLDLWI